MYVKIKPPKLPYTRLSVNKNKIYLFILKDLIREELYNHFLLLNAACRILCSKSNCLKFTSQAKQYLTSFFIAMKDYYGPQSQTLNSHCLIHLADDVEFFKCSLTAITAFSFESYLGKIKKYLRTPYRPVAQLCRRLYESSLTSKTKSKINSLFEVIKISKNNQIKEILFKNKFTISTSYPDNMILTNDQNIIKIHEIVQTENHDLKLKGVVWDIEKAIYNYPCDSSKLELWELKQKPSKLKTSCLVSFVSNKIIKMSVVKDNGVKKNYAFGMLH